ncbi:tetratricopeptide repeat protein [Streptomyces sp. NBC_01244]|nr:tetratricopeptide repeat protein [Streptomyces sp. NBC_01244]
MSLPKGLAEEVSKNLVMVARLIDEDPEQAYAYSRIALRLASRVAAVREAAGFAAYANQKYAEAIAEFRAAKRMTGSVELWPVIADCERGLGRPERALAMAGEPEVQKLDKAGQVEMRLVAAGARRDMDQLDAAIVTLQSPELASSSVQPWTARLRYAYADALLAAGREDEAREWFAKTLEADKDGATDASDRLAELDGVEFVDASADDSDVDVEDQDEDEDEDEVEPEFEAEFDDEDDEDDDDPEVVAAERASDQAEYYDEDDDEYEGDADVDADVDVTDEVVVLDEDEDEDEDDRQVDDRRDAGVRDDG